MRGLRVGALGIAPLIAAALLLGACGSETGPDGIEFEVGLQIESGMSREEVADLLPEAPILSAGPEVRSKAGGGCDYYAIAQQSYKNVWLVCFTESGSVDFASPDFVPERQLLAPDDAAPGRAALIGRGDAICNATERTLTGPASKLNRALRNSDAPDARADALDGLAGFVDGLSEQRLRLEAFDAPEDKRDLLESYLAGLGSQIETLGSARDALNAGEVGDFDAGLGQLTEIGTEAVEAAIEYGFVTCDAVNFGATPEL